MIIYSMMTSPLGALLLTADGDALSGAYFTGEKAGPTIGPDWREAGHAPILVEARRQLTEYFAGRRRIFELPLAQHGTPFQLRVWRALCEIPYGETISYGELAKRVDLPGGARAVGLANGKNPIGIIVPCHRVIGANGTLTGYAGGLENKRMLLAMEKDWFQE